MTFEQPVILTSDKAAAWAASRQLLLIASPALSVPKRTFCYQGPLSHPSQWGLDLSWGVDEAVGPFYSLLEVAAALSVYASHIP